MYLPECPAADTPEYKAYKTFTAIKFLWQTDGVLDPAQGGSLDPSTDSLLENERWAAALKQTHIDEPKLRIIRKALSNNADP